MFFHIKFGFSLNVFLLILPSNLCIYACTGEDEYDEGDVVVDEWVDDLRKK